MSFLIAIGVLSPGCGGGGGDPVINARDVIPSGSGELAPARDSIEELEEGWEMEDLAVEDGVLILADRFIITVEETTDKKTANAVSPIADIASRTGYSVDQFQEIDSPIPNVKAYLVSVKSGSEVTAEIERFQKTEGVSRSLANALIEQPDETWESLSSAERVANSGDSVTDNWALEKIGLPEYDELSNLSERKVRVAVLDSGLDPTHPALSGIVAEGLNADDYRDISWHGTFVSGIIAAAHADSSGNDFRMRGVAEDRIELIPIIVCNSKKQCPYSMIMKGISQAMEMNADVINMSLCWKKTGYPGIANLLDAASEKALIVAAACNKDEDATNLMPAGYDKAFGVGATNSSDGRCTQTDWGEGRASNFGEVLDIAAPGDNIISTFNSKFPDFPNGTVFLYAVSDGTSFSTAFVSGLAALLMSMDDTMTPAQARNIIQQTSASIATDKYIGVGRIDAAAALQSVFSSLSQAASLSVSCEDSALYVNETTSCSAYAVDQFDNPISGDITCTTKFGYGTISSDGTFTAKEKGIEYVTCQMDSLVMLTTVSIVAAPACFSDADCDDTDALTLDTCANPGEANASCSHSAVSCASNADCDDDSDYTEDVCSNPGTANSSCEHNSIRCLSNTDCDDSNPLTIDTCSNPGVVSSSCANTEIECNSDFDCNDSDALTIDTCSNPGIVSSACTNTAIACNSNTDCDDSDPLTIDTCSDPGSISSSCTNTQIVCNSDTDCSDPTPACQDGGTVYSQCVGCTSDYYCSSGYTCEANNTCVQEASYEYFEIPRMPHPPVINSVSNSAAVAGASSFTVYADISGQIQKEVCCNGICESACAPNCDFSSCGRYDFYSQVNPQVAPNAPCIPNDNDTSGGSYTASCGGKTGNPTLFYYYNGYAYSISSIGMIFDPDLGVFKANVPIAGFVDGDEVRYFISASDSMGNVVTEIPDANIASCPTITSWDDAYQTPVGNNCGFSNAYENCGTLNSGTPTCSTGHSINDSTSDTCDESHTSVLNSQQDILGFSMGAGKGFTSLPSDVVLCGQMKLGANPPDVGTSSGPVDYYIMYIYNPDIIDTNEADPHVTNLKIISYMPEIAGADPNLVKVLWDGDCLSDPDIADPLTCRLIVGSGSEERFKVGAAGGEMTFIAKNALPDGSSLIGSSSKKAYITVSTGGVSLENGSVYYWESDSTTSMNLVMKNHAAILGPPTAPAPPIFPDTPTCMWPDGTEFSGGTCDQSATQPANNRCRIDINASLDCSFTDSYKVYHNTVNNFSTAENVQSIATGGDCLPKSFTHTVSTLDGGNHYYWVSGVNDSGPYETNSIDLFETRCTVENWEAPAVPESLACSTPAGQDGLCKCQWFLDTVANPSVVEFNVYRDGALISLPIPAALGENGYSMTDLSDLVNGTEYTYAVSSISTGGSESAQVTASCTPQDLKAPARVSSLSATLITGMYGVNLEWEASPEDDISGYNAWYCENMIPGYSCETAAGFTKMNGSLITGPLEYSDSSSFSQYDSEYCFWIEACDDCASSGTCPDNMGVPNCSIFDTATYYRKCFTVTAIPDAVAPLFPNNQTAQSSTAGECSISWSKTCSDENGPFILCDFPNADEMMGYQIMRVAAPGSDCSAVTVPNPSQVSPAAIAPQSSSYTDTGLTSGTTYCYRVYSYDVSNNFSRNEPIPSPTACTAQ